MSLNESKGNMYSWVTHTWNTIKGECPHGCTYCYATYSETTVQKNRLKHNPESPLLIGNFEDLNEEVRRKLNEEQTLF